MSGGHNLLLLLLLLLQGITAAQPHTKPHSTAVAWECHRGEQCTAI
jgi:hypothetical protein